ncbi:MAG: AraC family transcriptional regulator [Ahrensia sp.]
MVDDLVASRRHFSRSMAWVIPIIAVGIIGIDIIEALESSHELARLFTGAAMFVGTLLFAMSMSRLRESLIQTPAVTKKAAVTTNGLSAVDRIELGRVRDLMEHGAYLNSGLTIGALANEINIPEHRLRKLINNGLGYRNFASFINDHRIDMAKRELAKPDMASAQITTLAFDVGYASLAPFNRAFRERTGMSPREFREQMLQAQLQ